MNGTPTTTANVLVWPKGLLSADDLRRHLNGQRELVLAPRTVVTPLAADELRAKGIRVRWEPVTLPATPAKAGGWFYAQEKREPLVASVIQAAGREGLTLTALDGTPRALAESLASGYVGGIVFSSNVAAFACIANKVAGVRAVTVSNVGQVTRAKKGLGANIFAIEIPGPTYFEARQMVKAIVTGEVRCPEEIAKTLKELDGHAHR